MKTRGRVAFLLFCLTVSAGAAVAYRIVEMRRASVPPAQLFELVAAQINAFREADYSRAYHQVSSGFQEKFNVESFSELARTDYPDLLRAERMEFGSVRRAGRQAAVQVYFFLPDGAVAPCLYIFVWEDGAWKIDDARVQKRWPAGHTLGGLRT